MTFKTFIMVHFVILETILGTFFIPMIAIRKNQNHQLSFSFDLLLKLKGCLVLLLFFFKVNIKAFFRKPSSFDKSFLITFLVPRMQIMRLK